MRAFIFCLVITLGPVSLWACGEKDSCPATNCERQRCFDYINREGEFLNRPVYRCLDRCHIDCKALLAGRIESCNQNSGSDTEPPPQNSTQQD